MADVFLSYARPDKGTARLFAEAFQGSGLSVWWDDSLRSGETFDETIERALRDAKAVVVLWSPASVISRWVRAEATLADRNRTLVPVMIAPCQRPIIFELTHTADLTQWQGAREDRGWLALVADVRQLIEARAAPHGATQAAAVLRPDGARSPAVPRPAVAILPFVNMSGDPEQECFSDGVTEDIITDLARVSGMAVASRSAVFSYKGKTVAPAQLAQALKVTHVVEGSVRKAGNRVRITAQVLDAATDTPIWAERFDRKLGDIFAIQDEIAASVATTLRGGELTGPEQRALRRPATGAEPYEYFLRGRQSLHRMRRPDLERSCEMFSQAIDLDANYAPAWAGLATVHALLYEWWGSNQGDLVRADQASETAMRLAPQLADAHVARGLALAQHRRYEDAFVQFEAGIRINPNLYDACYYYGRACFASGAIERSAELFGRAAELNPEDFQSRFLMGQSLSMLGRHEEAQRANRDSLARAERALALNPDDGRVLALGSGALQYDGQVERARQWAQRALEVDANDMNALLNAACLHAKLGEKERALELLERACGRGWGKRDWIENDPDYDRLRDDPRFQALMAKLS